MLFRSQAIDSRVQPDSLNIKVRVVFKNSDHALKPGMLLATELDFIPQQQAIIPVQALEYSGTKRYVYLVDPQQKVHRTLVEPGERIDNNVVINKGLKTAIVLLYKG